ncbi:MAG: MBL fold metallo-hydrolase [Deltaproteobacteria bacterium]|nr:MBL fold metallo-hydrolase [Deltaproteobacteria bacterium]
MNITFLGGGSEIGASSALVEIGDSLLLVDCGMRMSGDSRLPDFGLLPAGGEIAGVILTHAHMDHSGALPVFHQHFPHVPVYATAPTCALVEVLLRDALNIARSKQESEGELPLYAPTAVESLLQHVTPVSFGAPTPIGNSRVTVTWFPAGHILGAACVGIEGTENGRTVRVLFSGDIAVANQLTVPGMLATPGFQPDVLVIESTYGNRLHSPRQLEEQRLLSMMTAIIEGKGKLLVPAFAIGRAQEVTLILIREMRNKRLPRFPVYIDGMVKTVCGVYSDFPAHQTPYARRLIEQHGNPFFNVIDEVRPVTSPKEREAILHGPPACIIASSGMLSGGASVVYAQGLVGDARNGIALTGYQDEESPGRRLLELADGVTENIALAGRSVPVHCQVSKYALSAHADSNELSRLIEVLNPREVVLVHGDSDARPALADLLYRSATKHRPVHLPRTGETIRVGPTRAGVTTVGRAPAPGIGGGVELTEQTLPLLATHLRTMTRKQPYSIAELLDLWYGTKAWDETHYATLTRLLDTPGRDFRRFPSRPHLYQVATATDPTPGAAATPASPFAEPNTLLARVDTLLGPETGLYKRGYHLATHELRLSFDFPAVAKVRHQDKIARIIAETGWSVVLNDMPQQERLFAVALECLPADARVTKGPALHLDRQEVSLALEVALPKSIREAATKKFHEETSFRLTVTWPGSTESAGATPAGVAPAPTTAPVEINTAYWTIEEAFRGRPETERPYRKSLKTLPDGTYIELAFLTPEVGARHHKLLNSVAAAIGYELRVKPEPNQIALLALVRQLIPTAWQLAKPPGVFKAERAVRVKCLAAPSPETPERRDLHARFTALTGYTLQIEGTVKGAGAG